MERKLMDIFEERRLAFKAKLQTIKAVNYKVFVTTLSQKVYEELEAIFAVEGEYRRGLSKAEENVLDTVIELVFCDNTWVPGIEKNTSKREENIESKELSMENNQNLKWIISLCTGVGSGILGLNPIVQLVVTAAGFVGGLFAEKMNSKVVKQGESRGLKHEISFTDQQLEAVIEEISKLLMRIDHAIASFSTQIVNSTQKLRENQKPIEVEGEKIFRKLMELLGMIKYSSQELNQDILADERALEGVLKNYHLEVTYFDKDKTLDEQEAFFDMIENPQIMAITPRSPALVKKGVAIISGRVDLPVSKARGQQDEK